MALLEVSNLTASYGEGRVLEDVSISVESGAVSGVVGPNGHGKTTLLRAISGLMPRLSGSIRFDGVELRGKSAETIAGAGIVHVPQGDLIYKDMSVLENLLMGGFSNDNSAITAAQLDKVYALFPKLKERTAQTASSLSGGERRMLGIGRGLMMARVRFLMLDEPSLGLAPIVIDQIYDAIGTLAAQGLTILVVEENIQRISGMADQMSLVNHGGIIWSGLASALAENTQLKKTYLGA
jgi:branched-chain amino acid transport system ATP-binding protein